MSRKEERTEEICQAAAGCWYMLILSDLNWLERIGTIQTTKQTYERKKKKKVKEMIKNKK